MGQHVCPWKLSTETAHPKKLIQFLGWACQVPLNFCFYTNRNKVMGLEKAPPTYLLMWQAPWIVCMISVFCFSQKNQNESVGISLITLGSVNSLNLLVSYRLKELLSS